jgi:hypothetical protein
MRMGICDRSLPDRAPPRSNHLDDVSTGRVDVDDIRAIDPRMAGANALLAAGGNHD